MIKVYWPLIAVTVLKAKQVQQSIMDDGFDVIPRGAFICLLGIKNILKIGH